MLIAWQLAGWLGLVDVTFSSSPIRIVKALVTIFRTGEIYPALGATGLELFLGLLVTFVAGIPAGLLIGRVGWLYDMTEPIINILYSVPFVLFLPIIIFWFGIDDASRVLVIIWSAILPLIINVTAGVRALDHDYQRVAAVYCAPRIKFFSAVALPATLPYILAGVRQALGRALVGAIVAEFFMSSQGLGYFVQQQTSGLNMDSAMAGIVLLAVAALLLNGGVRALERRFTHWAGAQ